MLEIFPSSLIMVSESLAFPGATASGCLTEMEPYEGVRPRLKQASSRALLITCPLCPLQWLFVLIVCVSTTRLSVVYPRGEMQGSQWPPKLALENLYYKAVVLKSRGLFLGTKGDLGCFYTHRLLQMIRLFPGTLASIHFMSRKPKPCLDFLSRC